MPMIVGTTITSMMAERIEQDLAVGGADRPLRLQYASRATCE